jgi:hypothetical protein
MVLLIYSFLKLFIVDTDLQIVTNLFCAGAIKI